jgi:hypothetical protein
MKTNDETVWIVVEVQSGIAIEARAYRREAAAERRFSTRQRIINLQEDDVQIFDVKLQPKS